jgi:hypothetical protein
LHIDDEPAVEIQEQNSGSGSGTNNDTSSDDGEEDDETYKMSPRGLKRSGRFMRGSTSSSGHGTSGGNGGVQHGEDEEEDVNMQSEQPVPVTGVMMRKPSVPHDYVKADYMKRGMTVKARKEREKNPFNNKKEKSVEYRFQTKFHQDFYESAILSKKYKVARSQYVDWQKFEYMEYPIFDEIIDECKKKDVYNIMGFKYNWNNEIITQLYVTCYFEEDGDVRWLHWMTEGKWFKINYFEFATMFGFEKSDYGRNKIHIRSHLPKEDMKDMYLPSRKWEYGRPKGLIPFYGYLNKFFRKTLAPREGDAHNILAFGRNLLLALCPSEPEFSVFDYIWEEIKSISESPQKYCGYGAYLMFMID